MARIILGSGKYDTERKKQWESRKSSRRIFGTSEKASLTDALTYTGASLGAGIAGVGEGIVDLIGAGGDLLSGNPERAEARFLDSRVSDWRESVRKETHMDQGDFFGTVGSFAGDVAQGIGQSAYFLLDIPVPGLGTGLFFTGVGSQGVSNAAATTGKVGAGEIAYGALTGAVEAATEKLIGAGGQAAKKLTSAATRQVGKKAASSTARRASRPIGRTVIYDVLKSMGGEAVEEGISELLDAPLRRVTGVDPQATTNLADVLYSMGVGAVSGGLMAAPVTIADHKANESRGRKTAAAGETERVIGAARAARDAADAYVTMAARNRTRLQEDRRAEKKTTERDQTTASPESTTPSESSGAGQGEAAQSPDTLLASMKQEDSPRAWRKRSRRTERFGKALADGLAVWDEMTEAERGSSSGMAVLGEIRANLSFHELNLVIDEEAENILALSDEDLAPIVREINEIAKANPKQNRTSEYTVDDLRRNRDGILVQLAGRRVIIAFAEEELTRTEARDETTAPNTVTEEETEGESGVDNQSAPKQSLTGEPPRNPWMPTDEELDRQYGSWIDDPYRDELAILDRMTKDYGLSETARDLIKSDYVLNGDGMDLRKYLNSFVAEYMRARANITEPGFETFPISEETVKTARFIGEVERKEATARAEKKREEAARITKRSATKDTYTPAHVHFEGTVPGADGKMIQTNGRGLSERQSATVTVAKIIANAAGCEVYLYASYERDGRRYVTIDGREAEAPNGYKDAQGNLHIDLNAGMNGQGLGVFTLGHETAHLIHDYAPADFHEIGRRIVELMEGKGVNVESLIFNKMDTLTARGRFADTTADNSRKFDIAYEEVIADSLESILQDGRAVQALVEIRPSLFERISNSLKSMIRKIKKALAGLKPESEAGRLVADMVDAMDEIRDMYVVALTTVGERRKAETKASGDAKESIRPTYTAELDRWARRGMPDGESFVLGETGEILQGLGAVENDIYINGDKIKKILNEHPEMSLDEIKKIPHILEYPVLILKSRNVGRAERENARMSIFGSVKNKNGQPVMVILDIHPIEGRMIINDMQKVSSAYVKTTAPAEFVRKSEVMYVDKKRSRSLLRAIGFHMPMGVSDSSFIGSISYNGQIVNLSGKFFPEIFSEGEDEGMDVRYSDRPESTDAEFTDAAIAESYFGITNRISEAGYLLTNGKLLDFSGRHEGASGGERTIDHRDIADAFGSGYSGSTYTGGMVRFMQAGNIRLSPESGGINLVVKPTEPQLDTLNRYITSFRGEVMLDIDDENGRTIISVEYPKRTDARRIIRDIMDYFDEGIVPKEPSNLGQFRYSDRPSPFDDAALRTGLDPGTNEETPASTARETKDGSEKAAGIEREAAVEALYNIRAILDEEFSAIYTDGSYDGVRMKKKIESHLLGRLESAMESANRRPICDEIAEEVMASAVLEHYVNDDAVETALRERDVLAGYRRKIDLSSIRSDLQAVFDDQLPDVERRWGRKSDGLAPDALQDELAERLGRGIPLPPNSRPADLIVWMEAEWQSLGERIDRETAETLKAVSSSETYEKARAAISDIIFEQMNRIQYDAAAREAVKVYNAALKSAMKRGRAYIRAERKALGEHMRERIADVRRRRDEKIKRVQDEARRRMDKLKDKHAKAEARLIMENTERLKKAREQNREWRESFERGEKKRVIVNIINRWLNLLEHPTKTRNIPKAMQELVADMIAAVNIDTIEEAKRCATLQEKIDAELAREEPDMEKIRIWEMSMDSIREKGRTMDLTIERVGRLYSKIKSSKDPALMVCYDSAVMERINTIDTDVVRGRSLHELTLEELRLVRETMDMVIHAVTEYQNLMASEKRQTIRDASARIQEELAPVIEKREARIQKHFPGTDGRTPSLIKRLKGMAIDELKPLYFFDEIESPTLRNLFRNLYEKSERTYAEDIRYIRAYRRKIEKEFQIKTWDRETRRTFQTEDGTVRLKLGQIMAIYASSKREQAVGHLLTGGFCLDPNEEELLRIKDGKVKVPIKTGIDHVQRYHLTEEQMHQIAEALTDEQRRYVDTMVEFLSTDMAAWGNEVSMKLYNVELFGEAFYYPIKTMDAYRAEATSQERGTPMLKNMGMTKPTNRDATNPLLISDFDSVWAGHCRDMTSYHAMVLPLEDLRRVFEYGSAEDTVGTGSTKSAIINAYGEAATRYISTLITDLNGGLRQDPTGSFTAKTISLMKKSRTMMSLSVIMQQYLSIVRAMALIDPKHFPSKTPAKIGTAFSEQWDLMCRYAATPTIKDVGGFDTGMGRRMTDYILAPDYEGAAEQTKAFFTDASFRDDVFGFLPATADRYAWMTIWGAVENETAARQSDLKRGSKAFYRAVGTRFDEIVRYTQVYDSTLSRSALMRSKHAVLQMATAFMAEPTTTVNMLVGAFRQFRNGSRKAGSRTAGFAIGSMVLTALAASIIYAMRDDDEDETYTEKYVQSAAEQLRPWVMFPSLLPIARDVVSLFEGYNIERTDMTVYGDAVDAFRTLQSSAKSGWQKFEAFTGSLGTLFGIPTRNIMRDGRAVYNTIFKTAKGESPDLAYAFRQGFFGIESSDGQRLYDLRLADNQVQYNRVAARFATEAKAEAALRRAIRDSDPRIAKAADARLSGDLKEAIAIQKEIVAEGYFTNEEVLGAVNAEVNAIKKYEQENTP